MDPGARPRRGIPWEGNYSSWLDQKSRRLAQEEKASTARQKTLEHELEWVRMAPRARHAKSKARITAYEDLLRQDAEKRTEQLEELYLPAGPRLGDLVVEAKGVRKGYGDNLLMEDLSFSLPPGGVVGVIGPNGAGKTTLFRMIVGQEKPDGGTLRVGETVVLSYVDQSRDVLDGEQNVWQAISGGHDLIALGKREVPSRAYVSWFNFKGSDQQKLVRDLSGGERNRVHMARMFKSGGNVLLLDEPTNDLDVDTLRTLEEAILNFRRLRRHHQPRPLVPRPDRDPHPRVRGGQPGGVVRGELPGVRGRPEAAASGPKPTNLTASNIVSSRVLAGQGTLPFF